MFYWRWSMGTEIYQGEGRKFIPVPYAITQILAYNNTGLSPSGEAVLHRHSYSENPPGGTQT